MKLHIGGKKAKQGWKILNIQKNENVDFVGDIQDLSQFKTETVEIVYASHVLEHIRQHKALDALKGIYRILKKNGKLYISVPNMDVLCEAFIDKNLNKTQKLHVMRMIFGGQMDDYDFHYFGWNFDFMKHFLSIAGFPKCEKVESFGLFNDTSNFKPYGFFISLNIIAYK